MILRTHIKEKGAEKSILRAILTNKLFIWSSVLEKRSLVNENIAIC